MLDLKHSIVFNREKELSGLQSDRFSNDSDSFMHHWRQIYQLNYIAVVRVLFAFTLFEVIAVFNCLQNWKFWRDAALNKEEVAFVQGVEKVFAIHFLYYSLRLFVGSPFCDSLNELSFE